MDKMLEGISGTTNLDKCYVRKSEVKYMGHVITDKCLRPDPSKVAAIVDMPAPTIKEGVRRLLGHVQYLAKFMTNLSQLDAPLRQLMKSEVLFLWESEQEKSFQELKRLCSISPVLAYFNVSKPVEVVCESRWTRSRHYAGRTCNRLCVPILVRV